MIPLRFQKGGSNLFLNMPDGGTVGPMGNSPMGLPEYQTGASMGGVNEKTMQDFNHYYSNGFPMMQEGGDPNAEEEEDEDTTFYSDRMNTFIQKIRDAAEKNLETAVMEQDQQQPMAQYGRSAGNDPMNSYDPGNLDAFAKTANYMKGLGQGAVSGYIQRMGALGPNDYYYKEKNIYKDTSKGAPLGTQTFTDANGVQSSISPEEAANRANYALYNKRNGGSLTRYQQDVNSGQSGTVQDPNGVAALADKMYAEQGFIKDANGGWVKPETSQNPPANATANNTGTGKKPVPNGSEIIGGNGDPNMLYNGHNSTNENTTVINGVRYAVDPTTREILGYNPQSSRGTQDYNNYNPYGGYNPYGAYGSMRGRNLGVISKNRLTKDFRENMLAGNYDNAQLLGLSNIETRRAMDPGNRIKSMTFSYGQPIPGGRTTVNRPPSNNSTQTSSGSSSTAPTGANNPPVNPSASTLTPEQKIQQAMDFTFRPGQGPYNTEPDFPGLEKPRVGPWDVDADSWSNPSEYVDPTNTDSNIDPATDPRGANYGKEDYPEDLVLKESGKAVKASDNNWYVKMPDGTIQKSMDREVLRKKTGFADGGALRKFMRMYQGDIGPSSVREMSIADMPEMVDQIVEPESNNTPMEFKPYEMTDADRVRAVDAGTEYEKLEPGDGMAPSFDVKTKTKKKRIGNPEKDLAAINFATKIAGARDAANAETDYRKRTGASFNFNPIRSTEGNYDILSGDFRRGKRAADGNDAFHSGFGNYAQMGGSMMDNLKEGDEVYLTEDQINQIIKRGGKLSYL